MIQNFQRMKFHNDAWYNWIVCLQVNDDMGTLLSLSTWSPALPWNPGSPLLPRRPW